MSIFEDLGLYYSGSWAYDQGNQRAVFIQGFHQLHNSQGDDLATKYHRNFTSFSEVLSEPNLVVDVDYLGSKRIDRAAVPANKINFSWPNIGLTNYKDNAYICSRISQRSVAKGLTQRTFKIKNVNSYIEGVLSRVPYDHYPPLSPSSKDSYIFIDGLYTNRYPSMVSALEMLIKGSAFSVAISSNLALGLLPNKNDLGVFLYEELIGTFNISTMKVSLDIGRYTDPSSTILLNEIKRKLESY